MKLAPFQGWRLSWRQVKGPANGAAYLTGPNNQLLFDGVYSYLYDPEGNRTARFIDVNVNGLLDAGDTAATTYAWDHRNRLTRVTDYDLYGDPATRAIDYLYDTENRWIGRDVDLDADGQIDTRTRFAYDGNQIVMQFDRAAATTDDPAEPLTVDDVSHRYLWNPAAVDQLMADEQVTDSAVAGDIVWPLGDHQGTIRDLAVYDPATDTTTVANHRTFDAYGNLQSQTSATVDCLFAYTGRPIDETTGLQNNLHRWYDPAVGRWMSEDPIGFKGRDANLYAYVGNSSVNATDPSGRAGVVSVWIEEIDSGYSAMISPVNGSTQAAGWTKIGDNLWQAGEGATFEGLVGLVDKRLAPSKNAMCIRPVIHGVDPAIVGAMREAWGDVNRKGVAPRPAVGGVYDVSSLVMKKTQNGAPVAVSVGSDTNNYIGAATHFFGATHFDSPAKLAEYLRVVSQDGATPIGTLYLIGHGNEFLRGIGGRRDGPAGSHQVFKLGDLTLAAKAALGGRNLYGSNQNLLAYWPSFDEAVDGKLPPVAWLATDAEVRVIGCKTSSFAATIARHWLRSTEAVAYGTLKNTWAPGNAMGWGNESATAQDLSLPNSSTAQEYFAPNQKKTHVPEHWAWRRVPGPHGAGLRQVRVRVPEISEPETVWRAHRGTKP